MSAILQLGGIVWSAATTLLLVVFFLLAERLLAPASRRSLRGTVFNLTYTILSTAAGAVFSPLVSLGTVAVVNGFGGGAVILPSHGFFLIPAVAAYTLTMDFGEYSFHRAQHRFPSLWAMHSLHHSDLVVNASTTPRHFWAEPAIKSVTIYLAVGLLFRASTPVIAAYGLISMWNYVLHMNIRLSFGKTWFLLNSPQFHRVHHSAEPEHHDGNFAAIFTIFDALFGTAHVPSRDEYPVTGLQDGDLPGSLLEAFLWPVHGWFRRSGNVGSKDSTTCSSTAPNVQ